MRHGNLHQSEKAGIFISDDLLLDFTVGPARGKIDPDVLCNESRMPTPARFAFLVARSPAADAAGFFSKRLLFSASKASRRSSGPPEAVPIKVDPASTQPERFDLTTIGLRQRHDE